MSAPVLDAAWLARLGTLADRPPRRPRVPLWAGPVRIGSVEPDYFGVALPASAIGPLGLVRPAADGWHVNGEPTAVLAALANALREAGRAHAWRDEQLAVTGDDGRAIATIERAVVRPLGIKTFAVHLAGVSPAGHHWVQQRALTKPSDPGLWDTLMGGMIPAADSIAQALERETWEEAGLRLPQLAQLAHGGSVQTRGPSREVEAGYVIEHIEWYRCVVPDGVVPVNQDGEVAQFKLMEPHEVAARLRGDEFTIEAALVLVNAGL